MSPEQARGEPLISVRPVLFRCRPVRNGDGPTAFFGTTSAVIFEAILNKVPASPVQLNPGLPVQLEPILNKTLEKDRELRCQTAAELRADLKRLKRDTDSSRAGVSAASQPSVVAARKDVPAPPMRGNKLTAALVGLALLLGAGQDCSPGSHFGGLQYPTRGITRSPSGAETFARRDLLRMGRHPLQRSVAGQSGRNFQRASRRGRVALSWTRAYPVLAVSPTGEMAVALNSHRTGTW